MRGFEDKLMNREMNEQMDICEFRVASATENVTKNIKDNSRNVKKYFEF